MSVINIHCLVGSSVTSPIGASPAGEELTILVEAFTSPGVAADLTGMYVVLHWTADPSGAELAVPIAGGVTGVTSFVFPAIATDDWNSGWFRFYVTLSGVGAPVAPLVATSFVQITGIPALPPSQQTIQVAGVVDLGFGTEATAPHGPHWVAPFGGALGMRCVCAVPAGTVRDASATAEVRVGHLVGSVWTTVTTIPLVQAVTPADWTFEGFATSGNLLALVVGSYQYQVWVTTSVGQFLSVDTASLDIEAGAGSAPTPAVLERIYYGVAAPGLTGTSVIEAALSYADVLATSDFDRAVSPSNQAVYLAYPDALTDPQWTNTGFAVGELAPRVVTLHNAAGVLTAYVLRETRYNQTGTALHFIAEFSHA